MKSPKNQIISDAIPDINLDTAEEAFKLPDRLLTTVALAAYMGYDPQYTSEVLVKKPGFPKAYRPFGGHPRWRKSEVDALLETQRNADETKE